MRPPRLQQSPHHLKCPSRIPPQLLRESSQVSSRATYKLTDLVSFGKGFALPDKFSISFDKRLPYRVTLEVILVGERFEVESLKAERKKNGPPVTSEGIRKIPVQELVRSEATRLIHRVKKNPKSPGESIITPARLQGLDRFAAEGPTDEALQHVAVIYRVAFAVRDRPTKAVEEAFGLARSTAARWVSTARDLGFIETPDPRRRD